MILSVPSYKMMFVEELLKEKTRTNIFRNLVMYKFWDDIPMSISPRQFGPPSVTDVCNGISISFNGRRVLKEAVFTIGAQDFGSLKRNLRRKFDKYEFGRWYK